MKKMIAALSLSALVGLTSGCATSYHRQAPTGGYGYTDTQLAPDVFRTNFEGNGRTSIFQAQDFAMRRAAEVSLANGFPYFETISHTRENRQSRRTMPGFAQTTFVGATAFTLFSPGREVVTNKPGTEVVARGFKTKPTDRYTFDAAELLQMYRNQYGN